MKNDDSWDCEKSDTNGDNGLMACFVNMQIQCSTFKLSYFLVVVSLAWFTHDIHSV